MRSVAAMLAGVALVCAACANGDARRDEAVAGLIASGAYSDAQASCLVGFVDAEIGLDVFDPGHELTEADVAVLAAARRQCAPFIDVPAGPAIVDDAEGRGEGQVDGELAARWHDEYVGSLVRDGGMAIAEATCVADSIVAVLGPAGLDPASSTTDEFASAEIDAIVACRR